MEQAEQGLEDISDMGIWRINIPRVLGLVDRCEGLHN